MDLLYTLFYLCASHAVCDYALQSDFIATAKNRHTQLGRQFWIWVLPSHALINGLGVALVLGPVFGLAETLAHFCIDFAKCDNKISLNQDQMLHLACKCLWLLLSLV